MTQQQVGDRLRPQHTRKNVCKWEHGQTEPSLSTIEQLAAALGVTPCWLAFGCEGRQVSLLMDNTILVRTAPDKEV